jgi:large repetitive protein
VVAQATDNVGEVGASSTATFTYNTSPPTVKVTYPVNGSSYSTWSGTISGTASTNAGAGTTVASAAVAVENTTTSKWWNGTAFSATSQTFEPATGTTSWTFALAASKLTTGDSYSVVGQGTDSAGNVGTSSTATFKYT